MYWLSGDPVYRIVVPVSAALVDVASSIPSGVVPTIFSTLMVSVRVPTGAPLQSVTFTFTGIVLPYLKMLVGGPGLTGCRIPVVVKLNENAEPLTVVPGPVSSSFTVTLIVNGPPGAYEWVRVTGDVAL